MKSRISDVTNKKDHITHLQSSPQLSPGFQVSLVVTSPTWYFNIQFLVVDIDLTILPHTNCVNTYFDDKVCS